MFEKFDQLGVVEVREQHTHWLPRKRAAATEWLRLQEVKQAESRFERDAERDEESLSISRKALANSERATRIAISAIILSIIMAISSVIK